MSIPIMVDRMSPVPIHRQLYDALRTAILSGQLPPGTRVPATRQLASQLEVARTTVMTAYEQLIADGYLEGRHGAWTSVASDLPREVVPEQLRLPVGGATPRITRNAADFIVGSGSFGPTLDVTYNFRWPFVPAIDLFPLKEWRRLVIEHWRTAQLAVPSALGLAGVPELRQELWNYVRVTRGIVCDPEQIIITTGSEQAIELLAKIVLKRGDRVAIEDPSHLGVRYLFRTHDAELLPIPVDGEGLVVEELRAQPGRSPVLVHTSPTHQFPTGVTLSLRRRLELLRWAVENQALIVEDDDASAFTYEGATFESMHALDSAGVVAHMGSFSKVLHPSIRIGYLIVPPPLVAATKVAHRLTARQAEVVHQCVLAMFMQRGGMARYLRRLRRMNIARRNALVEALGEAFGDEVVIGPVSSGLHVYVRWPNHPVSADVLDRLDAADVSVMPVEPLYLRPPAADSGVVMTFASLDEAKIRAGVAAIAKVLRGG